MAHQKEYMLSGLERELELYLGEEYEDGGAGSAKDYRWKDSKGNERVTRLEINPNDRTGKILAPEHYDDKGNLVPAETNEFKNVEKSADGTRIYGNPKGGLAQAYDVRIALVSNGEDSKIEVHKKLQTAKEWGKHKDPNKIYESTANELVGWVKTLNIPLRTSDLEMELDYEKIENPLPVSIEIPDLQVGDIIVSTTRYPLSKAIRVLSGSRVSHTAMYVGNGEVVEALGGGVVKHSVETATKDDKYAYVLRYPGLDSGAQSVIRDFAIKHASLKTPFDSWGMALRAGLRIPGGGDERFYCSELVLESYKMAGIQLFETTQKRPGDIDELRGTKLDYVGHIKLTKKQLRKLDDSEFEMPDEDNEWELDDVEEDDEFASEYEYEDDDESEDEFELENELNTLEDDGVTENFARRLYELSTRSYESEYELDEELNRALDAVENEFMVKRMHRKKKHGKRKGLFKKILSTGAKIVGKIASKTPIGSLIKAGTSLVRGDVKGALGNLAKAAVGVALPPGVGTVATAAMDALGSGEEGGEGGEEGEVRRGGRRKRAIRRVARIARDTYREVADTLPENFDHPLVANEVARKAVRKAMIKNGVKPPDKADGTPHQRRVIKLRPGEEVVIIRSRPKVS
jgi:cell wall-associated NlpC family hydrolase